MFDSLFGRNPRRQGQAASSFWRIDLRSLGGLYRVAAFVGLAISLALVSLALQKYVLAPEKETAS